MPEAHNKGKSLTLQHLNFQRPTLSMRLLHLTLSLYATSEGILGDTLSSRPPTTLHKSIHPQLVNPTSIPPLL